MYKCGKLKKVIGNKILFLVILEQCAAKAEANFNSAQQIQIHSFLLKTGLWSYKLNKMTQVYCVTLLHGTYIVKMACLQVLGSANNTKEYIYRTRAITQFLQFIYALWPLVVCMVSIQEWFLIKSGLLCRAYSN